MPTVDLDVDSDNDDSTHRTQAEDVIEDDESTGKVIVSTNGDADEDEVADVDDLTIDGAVYVPMFLELSTSVPISSDVTLTYDPAMLRIWRKDAADSDRTWDDVVASGAAYPAASLGAAPGSVATLFVEALDGSTSFHSIEAAVGVITGAMRTLLKDKVTTAPTRLDLEAAKMQVGEDGNVAAGALPEGAAEDAPGAYIPVNDDDDDYDDFNKPDRDQQGAIAGEDDLLPLAVKAFKGAVAAGSQRLIVGEGLRAWLKQDRTEPVTGLTPLPLDKDTQVYVEGFAIGRRSLRLAYSDANGKIQIGQVGADTLRVNVFKWTGPLNVPEHGNYRYTAGPANLPVGAQWVEPVGGEIVLMSDPKSATIMWDGGDAGVVGRAKLLIDDNYTWGLNVNVVAVKVEAPEEGDAFKAGTPVNGEVTDDSTVGKVKAILSGGANDPGLTSRATVTLSGPLQGRGVKQMRVGFSQDVVLTRLRVKYDGVEDPRVSSLEGHTVRLDGNPSGMRPYYNTEDPNSIFFNPTAANKSKTLVAKDTPSALVPIFFNKNNQARNDVTAVDLQYDFELYMIAASTDARNDADDVYVRQAKGTGGWHWTVRQDLGAAPNYAFTPDAASTIKPPTGWEAVTDGSEQDETRPWANTSYLDLRHWLGN